MARFSNQRLLQAFDVLHELYAFQDQDAFTQQLPASMAARMVNVPLHCGQMVMSIAKTRLSNFAQLMRVRVETDESSPPQLAVFGAWSASPGTIWDRNAALGASTPWKRMRCIRGRGTSAARRCRSSSGLITRWVVPSRYGVLSCNTTSPVGVRAGVCGLGPGGCHSSPCKARGFPGRSSNATQPSDRDCPISRNSDCELGEGFRVDKILTY